MERAITTEDLDVVAARYGRARAHIETAVENRFIPPARAYGRRGAAPQWRYPPDTGRRLSKLFWLQDRGYRGNALRFAWWWLGWMPWSDAVAEYITAVVRHYPSQLSARLKTKRCQYLEKTRKGVREGKNYTLPAKVLQSNANIVPIAQLTDSLPYSQIVEHLQAIDPTLPYNAQNLPDIAQHIITACVATDDLSQNYSAPYISALQQEADKYVGFSPHLQPLAVALIKAIADPDLISKMALAVTAVPKGTFRRKNSSLEQNQRRLRYESMKICRKLIVCYRALYCKASKRVLVRAGPWAHPKLACRALITAYGLYIVGALATSERKNTL